jgi:hypothetical protein
MSVVVDEYDHGQFCFTSCVEIEDVLRNASRISTADYESVRLAKRGF